MEKIAIPVISTSLLLVVFTTLGFFEADMDIILAVFLISPFAIIWMVYQVLKSGTPSHKTWDEYFYEDFDYRRNGKE